MTQASPPALSVLIVNFNGGPWLTHCVESVLDSEQASEILVGDNGSHDDSLAQLAALLARHPDGARCRVLPNGANLGFARAVNRLLAQARGDHLLLLNPDCVVSAAALRATRQVLEADPGCGMAGCLIVNPDGSEQRGCRRRLPTVRTALFRSFPFLRRLAGADLSPEALDFDLTGTPLPAAPKAIEAISGAFMMIRRDALDRVGPMDEGYFLHCEDLDWCQRFAAHGYRILFVPGVSILHRQGTCSAGRPLRVEWHKHRGMLRYFRKHHGASQPGLTLLVAAGIAVRLLLTVVRQVLRGRRSGPA